MSILDSLLSVASGGISGILGTVVSSVANYQSKKLDIELEKQKSADEIEMRKLDIQAQAAEVAAQAQIAQIQTQGEVDKADDAALAASYKTEPTQYSNPTLLSHMQEWIFVLLDTLRASIRPLMAIYLCTLTSLIYFQVKGLLKIETADATDLLNKLVNTILYLFTTCTLWYYGARAQEKK